MLQTTKTLKRIFIALIVISTIYSLVNWEDFCKFVENIEQWTY